MIKIVSGEPSVYGLNEELINELVVREGGKPPFDDERIKDKNIYDYFSKLFYKEIKEFLKNTYNVELKNEKPKVKVERVLNYSHNRSLMKKYWDKFLLNRKKFHLYKGKFYFYEFGYHVDEPILLFRLKKDDISDFLNKKPKQLNNVIKWFVDTSDKIRKSNYFILIPVYGVISVLLLYENEKRLDSLVQLTFSGDVFELLLYQSLVYGFLIYGVTTKWDFNHLDKISNWRWIEILITYPFFGSIITSFIFLIWRVLKKFFIYIIS